MTLSTELTLRQGFQHNSTNFILQFQAMNDESAQYRRAFKYAFPVVTLAITFNIPKFLEAGIRWCEPVTNGYCHDNLTYSSELVPFVYPTELRKRPEYTIYYNNWARIFILGVIPTALLIFFNTKIYQDIRVSSFPGFQCTKPPNVKLF